MPRVVEADLANAGRGTGRLEDVLVEDLQLTQAQAYEAAYRFVWQYNERESAPDEASLELMVVAMEPVEDYAKTNDPASWSDWLKCVRDTLDGAPLPRFPRR